MHHPEAFWKDTWNLHQQEAPKGVSKVLSKFIFM
jgi:hypothetical protein